MFKKQIMKFKIIKYADITNLISVPNENKS